MVFGALDEALQSFARAWSPLIDSAAVPQSFTIFFSSSSSSSPSELNIICHLQLELWLLKVTFIRLWELLISRPLYFPVYHKLIVKGKLQRNGFPKIFFPYHPNYSLSSMIGFPSILKVFLFLETGLRWCRNIYLDWVKRRKSFRIGKFPNSTVTPWSLLFSGVAGNLGKSLQVIYNTGFCTNPIIPMVP